MQTKYAPPLAALAFLWSANLCAQAPEIRIVEPDFSEAMETSASSIEIRGVAKGPGVKNVFIHEQSGTLRQLQTDAAEDGKELTFRTGEIPLKRGLNDIVITAVEKGNRASAKHLTIIRAGGDETFAPMRTGLWRGRTVLYQEIDGLAIAEGDIVIGAAGEIPLPGLSEAQAQSRKGVRRHGLTQDFPSDLWPLSGGVRKVPYVITASSNAASAISAFNASLSGIIQFVARTSETDFVNFNQTGSGGGCIQIDFVEGNAAPLQQTLNALEQD